MSSIGLHDLVAALVSAVAEAEQVVRVHQIRNLRSFFTETNEPVTVDIQIPRPTPDKDGPQTQGFKVPLITMVNVGNMSIAEMEVEFCTTIGEVSDERDQENAEPRAFGEGDDEDAEARMRAELGWTAEPPRLAVDVSTGPKSSDTGTASIKLRVRQAETPEGLARILGHLHKHL